MKDIIQELNDYKVPIIKIDQGLAKIKYENRFSQKLADANAFLARVGVPKSFATFSDDEQLLKQYASNFEEMSVASQSIKSNFWLESLKNGDEELVRFSASEEEYWDLVQLPEFRLDYSNGEIIATMSYATENHETITANLIRLLGNAFENNDVRVLGSNRPVRVQALKKNFEPDIQVIFGNTELYYYKKTMNATLNPAILVEVLSDSTQKYDRTDKFDAYKLIDTLQIMLFVDSNNMNIVVYSRTKKPNEWLMTTFTDLNDKIRIAGHSFPLKKIYQRVILNI